jgi:hypothetical protein
MDKDHGPDTIQLEDKAHRGAGTQADDMFGPAVRVVLAWRDVETAVERGAVVPAQAHALWADWADQGGPHRQAPPMLASVAAAKAGFDAAALAPQAVAPVGSSLGVSTGLALAAALAGGLLSYLLFAR